MIPGLRLENFHYERDIFRINYSDTSITNNDDLFTPVPGIGFNYNFENDFSVFVGVHRGYAPPRIKDAITNDGTALNLDAELSWNYEIGIRTNLTSFMYFEATGFLMDFSNQVIPVSVSSGGTGTGLVNGGETEHMGVEGGLRFDFHRIAKTNYSIVLSAFSTYVNTKYNPQSPRSPLAAAPATPVAPTRQPPKPVAAVAAPPVPAPAVVPKAAPVPAPAAPQPAAAPLDLKSLEARLRQTQAIGVLTKLSLKNQVDDLLVKFRAYHKRQGKATLAELRRNYDMLLLKVLSLLQRQRPAAGPGHRQVTHGNLEHPRGSEEVHRIQSDGRSNTVSIRAGALALVGIMTIGFVGTTLAAEEPASDVAVAKDLAAVIALQGLPCGKVVSATQQGEDDYVASCEDGYRYRVSVNADGRVVVEKLD